MNSDGEPEPIKKKKMKPYTHAPIRIWGPKMGFTDDKKIPTHLLLDGGKLVVTTAREDEFRKNVVSNIKRGVANFITELRTPIFRMHIDLDIYEPIEKPMTRTLLREWVGHMVHVVSEFFPLLIPDDPTMDAFAAIICTTPTKLNVEKHKMLWAKTGAHIIFPFVYVNSDQAIVIRSGLIQHFEKVYGRRHKHNIWEDVFDAQVYKSNGLRMIGSFKMENCSSCKGKPSKIKTCKTGQCDGSGKYSSNRCYRVTDVVAEGANQKALLDDCLKSVLAELRITSIRLPTTLVPHTMTVPDWFDHSFFHDEEASHRDRYKPTPLMREARRQALGELPENVLGAKELGIYKAPKLKGEDPICVAIQKWLKSPASGIPDVYRATCVIDVTVLNGDRGVPFYIVRTDSRGANTKTMEFTSSSMRTACIKSVSVDATPPKDAGTDGAETIIPQATYCHWNSNNCSFRSCVRKKQLPIPSFSQQT